MAPGGGTAPDSAAAAARALHTQERPEFNKGYSSTARLKGNWIQMTK